MHVGVIALLPPSVKASVLAIRARPQPLERHDYYSRPEKKQENR